MLPRPVVLAVGVALGALALLGRWLDAPADPMNGDPAGTIAAAGNPAGGRASQPRFVSWSHPTGLFGTEVPAGWRVDGQLGDAMDQGQFKIEATSPDGRSFVTLGHNWLSFMEFQYGPYRPGHQTVEAFILPGFVQSQSAYVGARVVYRSGLQRISMPNPYTGMTIPFDSGTLGFLLQRGDGGLSAGTAYGETMYIAVPGTPGLWRMRVFAAAIAPADEASQAAVRAALERLFGSLQLSDQFFELWNQAFQHTSEQMRSYSRQMDRVFSRYLRSAGSSISGKDPLEGWASMMRGGEYAEDDATGEQYWVGNDQDYWYVNPAGDVVGNSTGDVPSYSGDWRVLRRIGQ